MKVKPIKYHKNKNNSDYSELFPPPRLILYHKKKVATIFVNKKLWITFLNVYIIANLLPDAPIIL
jgi:hypothetical protein